jgi:hypothetical protein
MRGQPDAKPGLSADWPDSVPRHTDRQFHSRTAPAGRDATIIPAASPEITRCAGQKAFSEQLPCASANQGDYQPKNQNLSRHHKFIPDGSVYSTQVDVDKTFSVCQDAEAIRFRPKANRPSQARARPTPCGTCQGEATTKRGKPPGSSSGTARPCAEQPERLRGGRRSIGQATDSFLAGSLCGATGAMECRRKRH